MGKLTKKTLLECLEKYHNKSPESFEIPEFDKIKVSIIIPVYNQYSYTKDLLFSLINETKNIPYEIIIADDNSTDETKNIKEHIKNLNVIKNNTNKGFLLNVKNAINNAHGEYIVLLNDDMIVTPNWLDPLVYILENHNDIGLVGSTILYPDTSIQEQGGFIYKNGDSSWINTNKEYKYSTKIRDVDYCSGCGIIFKKDTWNKVGGFDERYVPAYYEDTDFCFEVKYNLGLRVVNTSKNAIFHFLHKSYGENSSYGNENRKLFTEKWAEVLENKDYSLIERQKRIKKVRESIFSIKNNYHDDKKYKVITILCIKIMIRVK